MLGADPPVETSQGDIGTGALPTATTSALIPRPRLLTRLTEEPAEVTLLCAPAGSGKSTLLQALVAAEVPEPVPTAWAALDERDDSVAGLWSTILAALRNADPSPDWSSLPDLRAPSDVVDAGFLDDLASTVEQHDGDVWLILDDLHLLQEQAALQSLDELLLRPPMNLRLVLSTRSEPPLALGRLRLNDRLHELRRDDLAFDGSEVAALLHAEGIEVDPAGAALLRDRTEGWAAGIRLAALLLRTHPDPERCIAEFDGATAAVESYLDSEVLRRQPQDVRGFLLRTSICSELPVELAARLSGRSDAGAVLEQLARRQTFTERVVGRREVYRYHPILRSFLAAVLQGSDPSQEVALHCLAAGWYRDADDPLHALEHLVRAGADTELIELLRAEGLGLVLDGHEVLLDRLLARLPADLADRDEIRLLRHIAALERRATTPDTAPAPADLARLVASPDRWVATTAAAAARREQLLEDPAEPPRSPTLLPDTATESGDLDLYAAYQHALWWLRTGQLERSTALLEDVGHRAEVLGRDALTLACASHLSVARLMSGALPGARQQAERALEVATQRGWWRTEKAMPAHLVLAWTGYLQADRQLAGRHAGVAGTTTGAATDPRLLQSLDSCSVLIGMEAGPEPHRLLTRYLAGLREEVLAQMTPTYHAHAGPLLVQAALRIGGGQRSRRGGAEPHQAEGGPGRAAAPAGTAAPRSGRPSRCPRGVGTDPERQGQAPGTGDPDHRPAAVRRPVPAARRRTPCPPGPPRGVVARQAHGAAAPLRRRQPGGPGAAARRPGPADPCRGIRRSGGHTPREGRPRRCRPDAHAGRGPGAARAALSADGGRDRDPPGGVGQHGQDPPPRPLPQARCEWAQGGRRGGSTSRPAVTPDRWRVGAARRHLQL